MQYKPWIPHYFWKPYTFGCNKWSDISLLWVKLCLNTWPRMKSRTFVIQPTFWQSLAHSPWERNRGTRAASSIATGRLYSIWVAQANNQSFDERLAFNTLLHFFFKFESDPKSTYTIQHEAPTMSNSSVARTQGQPAGFHGADTMITMNKLTWCMSRDECVSWLTIQFTNYGIVTSTEVS